MSDIYALHDNGLNNAPHVYGLEAKQTGVVYTPKILANYVAEKVLQLYLSDHQHPAIQPKFKILDPACGKGELLDSIWKSLNKRLLKQSTRLNAASCLCGIDIDKKSVTRTKERIRSLSNQRKTNRWNFACTNGLYPYNSRSPQAGWKKIRSKFDAIKGFDIIIANPPWGASHAKLKRTPPKRDFVCQQGQFDSSDLFFECAIENLRDGGYLAIIVPDSIFQHEKKVLRKLILEKTELRFIARLGEKIFWGVNRACTVLICRKSESPKKRDVQCFKLTSDARKSILLGHSDFSLAEKAASHFVPVSRFAHNPAFEFDIDILSKDDALLQKFKRGMDTLQNHLVGSRGVELSKKGRVCKCPHCKYWSPSPTGDFLTCSICKSVTKRDFAESTQIIFEDFSKGCTPMVAGESIQRYEIKKTFWIKPGYKGINYKDLEMYRDPKLLVRKTGVGISAAIDYLGSLTNQVVYIFKTRKGNEIPLEFYLGLLSSRAMYFYFAKTGGETEWRSHPYITQKKILELPVPQATILRNLYWQEVQLIASLVKKCTKLQRPITESEDAAIEKALARIFSLKKEDYELIYESIDRFEELLPVRALKKVGISDIFKD